MPNGRAQVGQYWLSEGFTDFFGDRSLLRSGIWSPRAYAAGVNRALERYAGSPLRNAPNSQLVAHAFENLDYILAPYDRGRLLAMLWDRRIVRATGGRRSLDDVLFRMRDDYMAAPADARPSPTENFLRAYRDLSGGLDLSDDIERYVVRGETITLPPNLYAPCRIVTVTQGGRTFQRITPPPTVEWATCASRMSGRPILVNR